MLTKDQLATLKTAIGTAEYANLPPRAVAEQLNAHAPIANPLPQAKVPKRLNALNLLTYLTPAESLEIYRTPALINDIKWAIDSNNRPALLALWTVTEQILSESSRAKIQAILAETEPDPLWTATLPGPSIVEKLGLPVVSARDVWIARDQA